MNAWKIRYCAALLFLFAATDSLLAAEEGVFDAPAEFYVSGEPNSLSTATQPPIHYEIFHKLTFEAGYGPEESRIGGSNDIFYSLRYEPTFIWYSPQKLWSKWMVFGRAWMNYDSEYIGNSSLSEDNTTNNQDQPEYFYSELREFYIKRTLIGDDPRFSASFGRQRFYDKYGVWWDDSIESLRFDYKGAFSKGFVAIARKYYYYNTDVNKLDPRDENITYFFGEYAWRWSQNNHVGARLMYEHDSSHPNPEDPEDFTGLRYGLFLTGDNLVLPITDYHVEIMGLTGDLDDTDTNWETVQRDIDGWAVMGEVGKLFSETPWRPRIALYGGLTDKPHNDDGFRLNNIQSDRVITPGSYSTRLVSSFVRLDLRNVMYYGISLKTQPTDRSSLDIRLSDIYMRDEKEALPVRVDEKHRGLQNNSSQSIGQAVDLNYYWKMFPKNYKGKHVDFNYLINMSYFRPGDAIDSGDDYRIYFGIMLRR